MDMQFFGANCIVLSSKSNRLVIDDNLATLGAKSITREGDVCLFTGQHAPTKSGEKLLIDMPGEYEIGNISVFGFEARSHMDEVGKKTATMYKLAWGDTKVLVTGHIFPKLTDAQLESIGIIDVMFVPVGGNGYTLDSIGALQIIKSVEPKVIIPTHYELSGLDYEVPQAGLEAALQNLGMEPKERVGKYQFKPAEVSDTTQLVVLER